MSDLFDITLQITLQNPVVFSDKSSDGANALATRDTLIVQDDAEILISAHLHERNPRLLTWRWEKWCRAPPFGQHKPTYSVHLLRVE